MSNLKLGVDVVGAHNLLPKDGEGSSNAFVELSFDGLKQRTTIKEKQLNPVWNESFCFNISDLSDLQCLTLDAYVYSRVGTTSSKSRTRSLLGKVNLPCSSFVQDSDAVVLHYRLEKHRTFSRVRGDLSLKVYIIDDQSTLVSTKLAAGDSLANANMDTTLAVAGNQSDEVGISITSHDQSHDQGANTVSTSSTAIAADESPVVPNKNATIAGVGNQGSSNPLALINRRTSNADGKKLGTYHQGPNGGHDHSDKSPITSSVPVAAVESLIEETVTNSALRSQGDPNPPVVTNSTSTSTIPNAEIGIVHTAGDHGDNASTSSKSSPIAEIQSLAIANKDTTLARSPLTAKVEARIGTGHAIIDHTLPSYDHGDKKPITSLPVGPMHFLYVRIVKARDLLAMDDSGNLSPFVEAIVGRYKGTTRRHFDKESNPVWDQVFSFSKVRLQASILKVVVKDKFENCVLGSVLFDLNEIPCAPPGSDTASYLAPQWYRLEDKNGNKMRGELMLSVWLGTQTDEAFSDAWNSDTVTVIDSAPLTSTVLGPNRYFAPRLWYLRVTVIEVEDLQFANESRLPNACVKVCIGNQILKTLTIQSRKRNLVWNEDLLFVTAEPFEDVLIFSFMDHAGPDNGEVIGRTIIPMTLVERRLDGHIASSRWYNLENPGLSKAEEKNRIHARICLEGGYCVSYGSSLYKCDLRPPAKHLWKSSIGVVELGIMDAEGLHPMKTCDGRGTVDSYCVAKYGPIWVRTRIHFDNLCPKYNETHTWDVYDTATVLTVCVFHYSSQLGQHNNSNGGRDLEMGKIRIRISTLEPGRRYTQSYPLLVVQPNGVNKLGELNLTIQFTCTSLVNMLSLYSQPVMPKMHHYRPIMDKQHDMLNARAINLVAQRFSRAEPALKKEVVEYMSDGSSHLWSMRRSKANFFRVEMVLSGLFQLLGWFRDIYMWKNPIMTVLAHALFLTLVCSPRLILPTTFLYMFLRGIWNFCFRPRDHPLIDTKLTQAEVLDPDELKEELETFPASQSQEVLMNRYDRLRKTAYILQKVVGDVASAGERLQMLLSWRDPSATAIFVTFSLVVALVLYVTPFEMVAGSAWFVMMMPRRLRYRLPSVLGPLMNFYKRLPDRTDVLL